MSTTTSIRYECITNHELDEVSWRLLEALNDPQYSAAFAELCVTRGAVSTAMRRRVAISLIVEAQKFLAAASVPGAPRMAPNKLVDAAWRTLIVDSWLCERLCKLFGTFIYHNPNPQSGTGNKADDLEATVSWMTELGLKPNPIIWSKGMAGYCSDYVLEPELARQTAERSSACGGG